MKARSLIFMFSILALPGFAPLSWSQDSQQPPGGNVEVLARGPVHEAFAEPTDLKPKPSPLIPRQPPPAVEEAPPQERPEGDNVTWIPGYWDWDEDANDFIWVSGFWRDVPPNRKWVPGYWQQVQGGWQRVNGFWAPEDQEEVQYLPPPPEPIAETPGSPPQPDSDFVPGTWVFQQNRYLWRPGFFVPHRAGWVWVPAKYIWTPGGCVFVDGYWDQPLHERGLLFAPVRFTGPIARGFTYTPSYVVRNDFLLGSLFVRSAVRSYYFGDYFDQRYAQGYVPWVDYHPVRNFLDPNYNYYRNHFGGSPAWDQNLRALYTARYRGEVPRPPRTLVQQTQVINNITQNKTVNNIVNKTVNITNIQNVHALTSVKQIHNTAVTNLASMAGPRVAAREAAAHQAAARVVHVQQLDREAHAQAIQRNSQLQAAALRRQQFEAQLLKQGHHVQADARPQAFKLEAAPRPPIPHPAAPAPQPAPRPGASAPPPHPAPMRTVPPRPPHPPVQHPMPPPGKPHKPS